MRVSPIASIAAARARVKLRLHLSGTKLLELKIGTRGTGPALR